MVGVDWPIEAPSMHIQKHYWLQALTFLFKVFVLYYMNMFAWFDETPVMTLQDIKDTKRTDGRTDGQCENSIPSTNTA